VGLDDERYQLASLGDLMELLVEGWRIEKMQYADRSEPSGPPAAYFSLVRGTSGEVRGVFVPDDGRALSHRAVVELFREHPGVWKHRSFASVDPPGADPPEAPEEWGEVPEPFPDAMVLVPATLREVVPVSQAQSAGGLDIALVALERHDGGARIGYMCHASDARTRGEMTMLDVIAVDDGGRRYRVATTDGRPEGNRLQGNLVLAPAIPDGVRRLTVTVGTVRDDGEGPRLTSGPWVFPIPLARGA
jgi:hypothetical protein